MRRGQDIIDREDREIARLEELSRKRPLTARESDQLQEMAMRQKARFRRLTARIEAMRAKLSCLEGMATEMGIAA